MNWKNFAINLGALLLFITILMVAIIGVNYWLGPINVYIIIGLHALAAAGMLFSFRKDFSSKELWIAIAIVAVIWLIAILLIYGGKLFGGHPKTEVETTSQNDVNKKTTDELDNANAQWANAISERDEAKNERDNAQSELSYASERIDSLKKALNKCKGVKEPLTPEEEIALLKREVANLKKGPKKITLTAEPDVTEEKFTNIKFGQPAPTITTENYDATGGSLPITQYEGDIKGDFWVTIDGQGHLLYALKASAWPITQAPKLNFENGPDFVLDQQAGYWYYIDLSRLVSVQEINNYQYAVEWNVYIGQTNYGTGSYPTYLPHQSLKPLINKVRGKEWGEISDSDLTQMRKENKNIWTPEAEGGLRPFRLDATNGRALGKEDRNLYQGWNFRNIIFAKKKTTITGQLFYSPKDSHSHKTYAIKPFTIMTT